MSEGLALPFADHAVRLKWHRAQRRESDTPFTAARLAEGFAAGAAMEVDLRLSADQHFVCLHDAYLGRETTGTGAVSAMPLAGLQLLRMRDSAGAPTGMPLLLLADLAALARAGHRQADLQLDLKDRLPLVGERAAAGLAEALGDCAARFTLSGHDWRAVRMLGRRVRDLRLGYDPCDRPEAAGLFTAADFRAFVELTLRTAPEAAIVYIQHRILLRGLAAGFDMIEAFHAAGKQVDAWTMKLGQPDLMQDLRRLAAARVDQITTGDALAFEQLWQSAPDSAAAM